MGEKRTLNAFFWPKSVKTGVFREESHIKFFLHPSFSGKSAFYTFSDNPGHKLLRILRKVWQNSQGQHN